MNAIPLPDELLRIIYRYINPIHEYVHYLDTLNEYEDTVYNITAYMNDMNEVTFARENIRARISTSSGLAAYACLQLEYLTEIEGFVKNNPRFARPTIKDELNEYQYKCQFDTTLTKQSLWRLENNIKIRRGIWEDPDEQTEINIVNDINEIVRNGSVRDLIYACITNNVHGFKGVLKRKITDGLISDSKIIRFINNNYPPEINRDLALRKRLVKKLMAV